MSCNEIWKEYIPGYVVSNMGRVCNVRTNHILKQQTLKNGYHVCVVSCGSRSNKKVIRVHVAVAKLFVENPNNLHEVNHLDGNKDNNSADNLEWCTHGDNMKHAIQTGLISTRCGELNGNSKLTGDDIKFIRENYVPRDQEFGARALARKYGVHHTTISHIVNGIVWNMA